MSLFETVAQDIHGIDQDPATKQRSDSLFSDVVDLYDDTPPFLLRIEATQLTKEADKYCEQCNYDTAIEYGKHAVELYEKAGKDSQYAVGLMNLSFYYWKANNHHEAVRLCTAALDINAQYGTDNLQYFSSLNNLAKYHADMGNYREALRLAKQDLEISVSTNPTYTFTVEKVGLSSQI